MPPGGRNNAWHSGRRRACGAAGGAAAAAGRSVDRRRVGGGARAGTHARIASHYRSQLQHAKRMATTISQQQLDGQRCLDFYCVALLDIHENRQNWEV
jgi:hypothetical protein